MKRNRRMQPGRILCALAILAAFAPWAGSKGEDVSRQPPEVYQDKVAPLLTPLEEVLRAKVPDKYSGEDGAILLDEEIQYIDEKGRRCIAYHRICKAFNDTGAKDIAEDTWSFRRANQKIHLALARTIQPDGRKIPVDPGATMIQTPQREADYSLYNDEGELRVIFPSVKPGTVTELIVVLEESQFRIPGEYTAAFGLAGGWPVVKSRFIVELPGAMADRLKITAIGHGVPEAVKEEPAKGRRRFTWKTDDVDPQPREINLPPTELTGPELLLTTLPDWDSFARWYAPLVEQGSTIKPALAAKIDEWTKNAHSPAEILDILMAKVADDVRYVGLEFGSADLQPHDCNAVWDNQYGDCKDKANLLRAMLRYKGIDASLVLLNTESTGFIDKRSPDYRGFSHAIVAVELEPGKYTFCDPTITYAKPGLLSPDDADRDVLLVKKNGAEWAHTPPTEAGVMHYDLDEKMEADGGISGWLTVESSGYYALWYADEYERLDKETIRSRANDIIQSFYSGAEIMDVTKTSLDNWDGVYRVKMYFVVPGTGRQKGAQTLGFPQAGLLFVNTGAQKKRETPYYLWPDLVKVTARIKLPAGVAPAEIPQPYKLESPPLDATAQWKVNGQECDASLEMHTKLDFLQPDQFEVFYNSLLSVHAWLDNPLSLAASGEAPAATGEGEITLDNFPMMPTGEGQLILVDQRYPDSGNLELRREALKKVLQYFPTDKPTLYNAGISLAILDWQEEKPKQAADEINNLLKTYRGSVSTEDAAWGEYMLARVDQDLQQTAEAQKILERVAADGAVSQRRRAWCWYQIAILQADKSPEAAMKALRQGMAFNTNAQPDEFTLLAKLLLVTGRTAELKKEIARLVEKKPDQYAAILTNLAQSAGDLLPAAKADARTQLLRMLDDAGKAADLGKQFYDAMQTARDTINAITVAARIREKLKQYLAKNPPMKLDAVAAQFKTRSDFARAMDAAEKDRKPEWCLRYALEILTRFEPDTDFPFYLWKAAAHADWNERYHDQPEPLLPVLLDLCDQLPSDNEDYFEGRFLRAKVCMRKGDLQGALKIHQELSGNPKLPPSYKITADERMADNLESMHDYKKALEVYHVIESEIEYADAKDCVLRAVFLNLEMGNRDEALRLIAFLDARGADAIKQASTGWQIMELAALAKDKSKAGAAWDASAKWWPAWLALEQKLGMKPPGDELIVPAFPATENLYGEMDTAVRSKDRDTYLQDLRKLAHGARWEPTLMIDLARMNTFDTLEVAPDCADDLRRFTITMCENMVSDDPQLIRKKQFYLTVAAIDNFDNAKALASIHDFEGKPQEDDVVTQAMARLWGVAAQRGEKSEVAPAIAALEKVLNSNDTVDERGLTVTVLADLYRLAGRPDDEEKLLKREMDNPQIKSSPQDLQTITERHDQLAKEGSDSKQLSQAVEHWLQKHKPAWYDYAEPKTLDDPRLANLDAVLKDPGQNFTTPEVVKLELMVASAPSQPYERRQQAFLDALDWLEDCSMTKQETKDLFEPIVDDDEFPEGLRLEMLWRAIWNARHEGRAADFEKLAANPMEKDFNDRTKATCELFHEALAVDQNSPDALAAFCDKLLQKELTPPSLKELRLAYDRLLELSQTDAAEKIYKRLADATLDSDVETGKASVQLDFLKALNRTKKWLPLTSALRKIALAKFPADTIKEPAVYSTLRDPEQFFQLDEAAATQVRLYQIKIQQFDPADFDFWYFFVMNLPRTDEDAKMTLDMIAAALENAPGDLERAEIVKDAFSMIDIDNPAQREALVKLEQQYRKPEEMPETYAMIRTQEIQWAWRSGQPVDMETDFASLHSSDTGEATWLKLGYYVQTKNIPLLKKTLESLSPDTLLSDRMLELSIKAFDLTGMKDELDLARDAAKKAIYLSVLQSWAMPGAYSPIKAYRLCEAIGDSSSIPPAWFDYLSRNVANRQDNFELSAEDAMLRQDWPRLLATMNEAIPAWPTFYHYYWLKSLALYRMGRTQDAVEPLQVYTKYSKDEPDYPQAMEWLSKIQPVAKQQ